MLMVISPAKTLDMDTQSCVYTKHSQPIFSDKSAELIKQLRTLKVDDIRKLMSVSESIAVLNCKRYQDWNLPFTNENAKAALLAFNGDVYQGMDVASFTRHDFEFAQKHLRILSGLYGCLRPMDLIQPYRLEMATSLKTRYGNNLYDFWGNLVTDTIEKELRGQKSKLLVNLASQEYFKVIQQKQLSINIVTPVFKDYKSGGYKVVSFLAKKARGMMCAYIIRHQIQDPLLMQCFNSEGYRFNEKESSAQEMVFLRR